MAKANYAQTNFTAGEVSKTMLSRPDVDRYANALKEARNVIILPQGPVAKRPGFRFVAAVKDSSKQVRIIPFSFSTSQTYILEVGDEYIRFFTNEAQLQDVITDKGFTNGTFASDISGWTDRSTGTGTATYSTGNLLLTSGAGTDYGRAYQKLPAGLGLNTYTVTLDATLGLVTYRVGTTAGGSDIASGSVASGVGVNFNFTLTAQSDVYVEFENITASTTRRIDNVVLSLASVPYEINTPYQESEIFQLKFTQSGDVLYIVHPDHQPRKLNRLGTARWTLEKLDFIDGPFDDVNVIAAKTMTTSAAGDTGTAVTVTATGHTPFASTDVGRLIRHKRVGKWRSIKITAFTNSASVSGVFQDDNPTGYTAGASPDWRLGEWSATTGWPEVVTFYQSRLMLSKNQTIYGSKTGDFEKFSPSDVDGVVQDNMGLKYTIGSDKVDKIVWLSASKVLAIGTVGGEWILRAGSLTNPEPLTPTNVLVTRETAYGSDQYLQVQRPGENVVIFVNRTTRRLHEYIFNYEVDGYTAPELTLLSRHITKSGIKDTAFANDNLWMSLENGKLVSLSYLRDQKVVGFSYHQLGGFLDGFTQAASESVAAIDSSDLSYEQLWSVNKRTIDGATKRYIEFLENQFEPEDDSDKEDAFFVDSGLTYTGSATNVITGLDHLEGEEVAVWADGAVRPNATVTAGSITLGSTDQTKASVAQIGLPYRALIETLDPEVGGDNGTAQGRIKRISHVTIRFIDTLGCLIGPDEDSLDDFYFRESDDPQDNSPPLYNGFKKTEFEGDLTEEANVVLVSDDPSPWTIGSILTDIVVHEQ